MGRVGFLRASVTVALLLAVLASIVATTDAAALRQAVSGLVPSSLAAVAILLAGGIVLSSLRLKLISGDLGYRLTFRESVAALSVSQLAGALFFQIAGQLIARGAVMSQQGIPPAATVVISGYERAVALSVSLLLAGCGAVYLFGTLSFDLSAGGHSLLKLAFGLTAAIAAGALFAWGGAIRQALAGLTRMSALRLFRSIAISAAVQLTTLAAYVALERSFAPHIDLLALAAASCVIMLAASLPISLGGWGLREMSAVVALQAIGLPSAAALLVALLIGLMSLAMVGATALILTLAGERRSGGTVTATQVRSPDYTAALEWTLPIAAATAIFFQVHLPTSGGGLNVNLADPIALIAAALFLLRHGKARPQWRVSGVNLSLGLATAVIVLSFIRGWASFGWTDWAFFNKTLGWFMLLAYAATGALIVRRACDRGLEMLLATFAAVGVTLAALDVGAIALGRSGVAAFADIAWRQAAGFSQNPNAFGFALVLVAAAVLSIRADERLRAILLSLTLAGVWFTGSRAAVGAAILLLVFAVAIGVRWRAAAGGLAGAAGMLAVVAVLPGALQAVLALLPSAAGGVGGEPTFPVLLGTLARESDGSNTLHMQTVLDGLAMAAAHPLWGAGLGAFTLQQLQFTGTALVIHSTPVWLLAETGVLGFAVFAGFAGRIALAELPHRAEPAARLLLLVLFGFGVMSAVHELLYQRSLWLLLGAALAMPALARRPQVVG